jgi:pyruvate kinase
MAGARVARALAYIDAVARTRIVATLGPATRARETVRALLDAGVDVVRLNLAHGTHEEHRTAIAHVREAARGRAVAILADLAGAKLRLDRPVTGSPGDIVELRLPPAVRPGDPVLLADGAVQLEVIDHARARVVVGGHVPAGKGINLPASRLDTTALSAKDRRDLAFLVDQGVDLVGLSFVASAATVVEVRAAGIPVVAKIERAEALANLAEIVAAADAIMVARGDLGVELPIERVPAIQKEVIALANQRARPVITATQMLHSMVQSRLPTRAEATDVVNAVLDGSDAVMLSEETAIGQHPVLVVQTMERLVLEAESLLVERPVPPQPVAADLVADSACRMAAAVGAAAIVVVTRSGHTARMVARRRPAAPIIALTPAEAIRRQLAVVWGVRAFVCPQLGADRPLDDEWRAALRLVGVPAGAPVVVAGTRPSREPAPADFVEVTTA